MLIVSNPDVDWSTDNYYTDIGIILVIQQGRVILQGTPSKEARGLENGENVQILYFHLHASWGCSINSYARKEYNLHISASNWVRADSPPRGGDIVVYVFDIKHPSLSIPFYFVLEALSNVFDSINSPTTLRFPALFFRSYFCLIGSFNYISLYESLPQP